MFYSTACVSVEGKGKGRGSGRGRNVLALIKRTSPFFLSRILNISWSVAIWKKKLAWFQEVKDAKSLTGVDPNRAWKPIQ